VVAPAPREPHDHGVHRESIERAVQLAGLDLAADTDLTIEGTDPVLRTPLHLGEGAAIALGLVGQEADRVWRMRGGKPQSLTVDVRHASASLNSYAFVRVDGGAPGRLDRPPHNVTGVWPCTGGRHIFLHGSFTHAPGILAELGIDAAASPDQIAAATNARGAFELEDALAAKGLCAAVCRTEDEWASHEQGRLLATKPVIEIKKIGDAPPQPLPDTARPLGGVRVLDLTRV
jgi:crotonobetainyl-CoA:carnitine CoA-transferase CaiB-like acyl-CoA transferase